MIENATDNQDSTQAAHIKDLDQQIADQKARLAEQNRLLRSESKEPSCDALQVSSNPRTVYEVNKVNVVKMQKTQCSPLIRMKVKVW